MHVRFSTCIGTPVIDDGTEEHIGSIVSMLIHPDIGTIEGFFVRIPRFLSSETLFLSSMDILHWGTHVRIANAEMLSPLEDRVRLQIFLEEGRSVLGQRILTESGLLLGKCNDVQFNTKTFVLEWLMPRRFLRWGLPLPASSIVEVKPEAIIVRDQAATRLIEEKTPILSSLEELTKAPVSGMMNR